MSTKITNQEQDQSTTYSDKEFDKIQSYTKVQLYEAYMVEHAARKQAEQVLKRANRMLAKLRFDMKL